MVTVQTAGLDAAALHNVERLFFQHIATDVHPGAQLAVYHQGHLVLDLWGGFADTQRCKQVERDTLFVLFSSTKPLASMALHLLMVFIPNGFRGKNTLTERCRVLSDAVRQAVMPD